MTNKVLWRLLLTPLFSSAVFWISQPVWASSSVFEAQTDESQSTEVQVDEIEQETNNLQTNEAQQVSDNLQADEIQQESDILQANEFQILEVEIAEGEELSEAIAPAESLSITFTTSTSASTMSQLTSVSQLSDVQPTDWAFQALQSLVERYGVIAGYPDGTYRGNRAITRYEFAAGLNAALDRVNELIAAGLAETITQEDLAALQRLQEEFAAELATLRGRVDSLEARTAELEANQFSTTTKLNADAIFAVSDVFGEDVDDLNTTVFQSRVRLTFDSSFTGSERLRTRFLFGNFDNFNQPGNEARFGYAANSNGNIVLDTLSYGFPVSDRASVVIYANGGSLDNLAFGNIIVPFDVAAARGALSRFAQRPPIYRVVNTRAAIATSLLLADNISLEVGYGAGEPNESSPGDGLFNGDYAILGQLTARNLFDGLDLAFTYVNSYLDTEVNDTGITAGLPTATGSIFANVDVDRPTATNSYTAQANFKLSDRFQIGGWAGFSAVRAIGLGDADVWNYGVTLAFPDLGGEGNLGGIVVGAQPRLTGSTPSVGAVLGRREDPDVGLHLEAFYRLALNDNIDITPGFFWITAPNHDNDNADIVVGTIRTTFRF